MVGLERDGGGLLALALWNGFFFCYCFNGLGAIALYLYAACLKASVRELSQPGEGNLTGTPELSGTAGKG